MKKFTLLLIGLSCSMLFHADAQSPLVKKWDYRFGGNKWDALTCFIQTRDDGLLLAGYSRSDSSGDKTQNCRDIPVGGFDFWIVKLNSTGQKEWDKRFGGYSDDRCYSVKQTLDGGFILGGYSYSGATGDKTQGHFGNGDYWLVKTDSLGNKLWDKTFGGAGQDFMQSLDITSDKGFILGGFSISGIGGNKTTATWGNKTDYWVIKTDSLGNKLWEKDIGGTEYDLMYTLLTTRDGGFLLGGTSGSPVSGNKSDPIWDTAGVQMRDLWIVRLDSAGNQLWDKDYGGIGNEWVTSIKETYDGGFILASDTWSDVSGNKTEPLWGSKDYWVLKIDSVGMIEWDKDVGGNDHEETYCTVDVTLDHGYIFTGCTWSDLSGDKSENNQGPTQMWVVKLDSSGNQLWDKTILTNGYDLLAYGIQLRDGCYLFGNYTNAGTGGYKTQGTQGDYDYWIIKYCDSTFIYANFSAPDVCPGACINFLNLSLNASSYQWYFSGANPDTSTVANPLNICYTTPGNYDVELIASGAAGTDTLFLNDYITVFPIPSPQGISQSGDTLFANTGSPFYQWYFNGIIISGATNYFYIAPASGDYNVVVTDSNGCEVEAVINDVIANIQYTVDSRQLTIYPNPVQDKFTIQNLEVTRGAAIEISIYNVMGEKVFSTVDYKLSAQAYPSLGGPIVNCKLSSGLYYLEVISENKIYRAKFIKQ